MSQVWVLISAIVAISLSSVASFGFDFDGGVTIDLYHALDAQDVEYFTPRGNINIDLSRGGTNMPSVVQSPLKGVERDQLKVLAEQDAFYRLKAIVRYNDGSNATFLTFSKACALARSQLSDNLWITLDGEGSVVSVSQSVPGPSATCRLTSNDVDALDEFNTEIMIKHTEAAPIPDTGSFIQKMEREREARDRGEVKDNRSFIAKYWMYIVPVVILLLISGSASPEQGGGGR